MSHGVTDIFCGVTGLCLEVTGFPRSDWLVVAGLSREQALVESATRLNGLSIFEQGLGCRDWGLGFVLRSWVEG